MPKFGNYSSLGEQKLPNFLLKGPDGGRVRVRRVGEGYPAASSARISSWTRPFVVRQLPRPRNGPPVKSVNTTITPRVKMVVSLSHREGLDFAYTLTHNV